jgi:hypothetical protein
MPGPTSKEGRQRAKERAFNEHAAIVLADPASFHPLKVERVRQGYTQAQLSALPSVRLNPSTVSCIERYFSRGTRNSRARLAYALDKDTIALFGE